MVKRGDVYYADLDPVIGSEQKGHRPIIVIQNDIGNLYSPTTIAAMVTSSQKKKLPTHVHVKDESSGLSDDSIVMLEQIRTIDIIYNRERKILHINSNLYKILSKII